MASQPTPPPADPTPLADPTTVPVDPPVPTPIDVPVVSPADPGIVPSGPGTTPGEIE